MDKLRYELETVIRTAGMVLRSAHANEYSIALKAPVRETGNQKSGC